MTTMPTSADAAKPRLHKSPKPFQDSVPESIKYLTLAQLNAVLAQARKNSVRDHAIILTAYSHAMRISEVGRLQLTDYDVATHRLKMRRMKKGHSPSYRTSEDVHRALTQWIKIRGPLSGPLFCSRRSKLGLTEPSRGISKRAIHNLFAAYAEKAGLPEDLRHFHVLRHSCAVHMVDKGIPLVQIQDWLGHKNISSTQVYAKVSDAKRDETAAVFHGESPPLDGSTWLHGRISSGSSGVQWRKDKKK